MGMVTQLGNRSWNMRTSLEYRLQEGPILVLLLLLRLPQDSRNYHWNWVEKTPTSSSPVISDICFGSVISSVSVDCDLDNAVSVSVRSSFANSGQICLCGSRILVEKSIKQEFERRLIDLIQCAAKRSEFDQLRARNKQNQGKFPSSIRM